MKASNMEPQPLQKGGGISTWAQSAMEALPKQIVFTWFPEENEHYDK
jgi:hypothetical protein